MHCHSFEISILAYTLQLNTDWMKESIMVAITQKSYLLYFLGLQVVLKAIIYLWNIFRPDVYDDVNCGSNSRFPRIEEMSHFHYAFVEFGKDPVKVRAKKFLILFHYRIFYFVDHLQTVSKTYVWMAQIGLH